MRCVRCGHSSAACHGTCWTECLPGSSLCSSPRGGELRRGVCLGQASPTDRLIHPPACTCSFLERLAAGRAAQQAAAQQAAATAAAQAAPAPDATPHPGPNAGHKDEGGGGGGAMLCLGRIERSMTLPTWRLTGVMVDSGAQEQPDGVRRRQGWRR